MSDLRSVIGASSRASLGRILSEFGPDASGDTARLDRVTGEQGGRFYFPEDERVHQSVRIAASQPDLDFPSFVTATALLLVDSLQGGDSADELAWLWQDFEEHYLLADPSARAALMNGFRLGDRSGRILLDASPVPEACLTRSRSDALRLGPGPVFDALLRSEASARSAGSAWADGVRVDLTEGDIAAARYLYEREVSIAPPGAERVDLIPWRPD